MTTDSNLLAELKSIRARVQRLIDQVEGNDQPDGTNSRVSQLAEQFADGEMLTLRRAVELALGQEPTNQDMKDFRGALAALSRRGRIRKQVFTLNGEAVWTARPIDEPEDDK